MKNAFLKLSIFVSVFVLTLSSCKYEDGPFISLRSKEERVTNVWVIDKAFDNGTDVTSDYEQYELNLDKDRNANLTSKYSSGNITFSFTTKGNWVFENKKNDIRFDFDDDDADMVYEILRLKENEFWIKEKGGSRELQLKSK